MRAVATREGFPKQAGTGAYELVLFAMLFANFAGYVDIFWNSQAVQMDFDDPAGNVLTQVLLMLSLAVAVFGIVRRRVAMPRVVFAVLPAVPFMLIALASVIWSPHPDVTLRRSLRLDTEIVTLTLLVLSIGNTSKVMRVLFGAALTVVFFDVLAALMVPSSFTPIGFSGVHGTKNGAGAFYMIGGALLAFSIRNRPAGLSKLAICTGIAVFFVMLVLSKSKTVFFVLPLCFSATVIFGWLSRQGSRSHHDLFFVWGFVGVAVGVVALSVAGEATILSLIPDPTFTGRTDMWRFAESQFEQHWYLGLGYGALWQSGDNISFLLTRSGVSWVANEAHNGYLDVLAQTGICGGLALVFYLATIGRRVATFVGSQAGENSYSAQWLIFVFLASLCYNLTESDYFRSNHLLFYNLIVASSFVDASVFKQKAVWQIVAKRRRGGTRFGGRRASLNAR